MLHRLRDKCLLLAVTTGVIVLYVYRKRTDPVQQIIQANADYAFGKERFTSEEHYRLTKEARDDTEE